MKIMKTTLLLIALLMSGCAYFIASSMEEENLETKPAINPLIVNFNDIHQFSQLLPGHIPEATDQILKKATQIRNEIIGIPSGKHTFKNTLVRLDDLFAVIESVWSPAYLMGSVHTDESIRNEGLEASRIIQKYITDLSLDEDIYKAVSSFSNTEEAATLTGYRKKFLDDTLLDYKRSGFGLIKEKRDKVKLVLNTLTDLGLEFDKNIRNVQDTLFVTEIQISGLPENYKSERLQEDGTYAIDMSYPSYVPFMNYSESDSARKSLRFKFNNRAVDNNMVVLDNILRERRNLVALLGYKSYAEYRTEDRMAKSPENVWAFQNDLKVKLRPKAEADVAEMLKIKSLKRGEDVKVIQPWEAGYYENKVLKQKYDLDPEEVRKYFEFHNVTQGLFIIYQRLFNITFKKIENPSVWHEDVQMYAAFDTPTGKLIGRFYLDMFPRENKYGHAAAFSVTMGKMTGNGYQIPATALVCNFPKPSELQPSLLTHDNVETYFHEFGHLVHGILTQSPLMSFAGTSVARDFVEAPSQMLENWVWQKEPLALFAKHYETEEVIPDELLDKMIAAKNLNSGTKALQQIFYGTLDFTLHDGYDPDGDKTTTEILAELQNSITLYPYQEGTHQQASFGHLNGYGAAYYGYKWSEVYAQDMFSIFENNGIMDAETGMKYRKIILEKGGTQNPLDLVKEFLGREPNSEAFLKSMGL